MTIDEALAEVGVTVKREQGKLQDQIGRLTQSLYQAEGKERDAKEQVRLLKEDNTKLRSQLEEWKLKCQSMRDHPEVKKAARERAEANLKAAEEALKKLKEEKHV